MITWTQTLNLFKLNKNTLKKALKVKFIKLRKIKKQSQKTSGEVLKFNFNVYYL